MVCEKLHLPAPDKHGNYWIDKSGTGRSILPVRSPNSEHKGEYYVSGSNGFITNGYSDFMYFKTPELGLAYLNELEEAAYNGKPVV